jgi:RHS repeat-associated protein
MATMTNAGGTVTYSYNALEMRVGKTGPTALVPTGAAYYVYNEEGKLLGEYDANGVPLYETIYLGAPVGVIKQTGTAGASNIGINLYNVSTDQVGAPRVIARQSDEAIVWRWDSAEAFGATAPDQNPSSLGTFSFNQRFPGQVFDAESGLFQNWNREYNPRIGRYMQSDPIGLLGGVNTFAYVAGAPLGGIDPTGLDWQDSIRNWWSASLAGFQSQSASEFGMKMLQGLPQEAALLGAIGTLKKLGSTEQCIAKGVATQEALATKVLTEAGELRLSASVAEKYAATRPYVTPLTVQEAIAGGVRAPDPQGVAGRFMYTIDAMYAAGPGKVVAGINGSEAAVVVKNSIGKFEVLVNELTNTVEHALFKSNK